MTIIQTIIFVVFLLIISGFFGWLIAKWRFKRYIKKLDKDIETNQSYDEIKKKIVEQEKTSIAREERDNERRRNIEGTNQGTNTEGRTNQRIDTGTPESGDREVGINTGERPIEETDADISSQGGTQERRGVQIPDTSNPREEVRDNQSDNRENPTEQRDSDEDWEDFD